MTSPENYLFDALEIVSAWDLPDDEAYIDAANQQAKLMAGHCFDDNCRESACLSDR